RGSGDRQLLAKGRNEPEGGRSDPSFSIWSAGMARHGWWFLFLALASGGWAQEVVVVYGATPAGIAAALNVARSGRTVALVEPSGNLGGMLTGGLSYTDFRSLESLQGTFRDYMERVERHYRTRYGERSQQLRDSFFGALAEPHVSLAVLEAMLAEHPSIQVRRRTRLVSAEAAAGVVRRIRVQGPKGEEWLAARVFIDASYEGDLAAAAGFDFRIGRESTREYGERFAGHIYFKDGKILDGSTGAGDHKIQCYNFRVVMTEDPANSAPLPEPPGYRPERYERILEGVRSGAILHPMSEAKNGVLRLQRLPNGKSDMNDVNTSPAGFGLPGQNWEYPAASAERRAAVFEEHRLYALGLLYFLRNDVRLPEAFRAEARRWNLPKDEFAETGHFPPALYVREARRFPG
ncbi:MAG: hypothetical protein B7Z55_15670, partial [Planctomycetales bacterium 12-60-4]